MGKLMEIADGGQQSAPAKMARHFLLSSHLKTFLFKEEGREKKRSFCFFLGEKKKGKKSIRI